MTNNIEEQIMAAVERRDSGQFNTLLEKLPTESINADRWSEIMSQYYALRGYALQIKRAR